MKNKLCKITLLVTSIAMLSSALISNKVATSAKALGEDEYYLDQVISFYSPFPVDEENAWQNENDFYCYVNQYDGSLAFRGNVGVPGYLSPKLVLTRTGDYYSFSDEYITVKLHTNDGVLDSVDFLSGTGAWANFVGTYVPSGPISYEISFNEHTTSILDRLAEKIGDEPTDWQSFVTSWVNDPSENWGLKYYDDFVSSGHVYTLDDVREVKNSVYYFLLTWDYLFNAYPVVSEYETLTDELRCALDHLMPVNDVFAYLLELDFDSVTEASDIEDLVNVGFAAYEGTLNALVDSDEKFDLGVFTNLFKEHLIIDSKEFAENPGEFTPEEFIIKRICERISGLTNIPWDYAMEMYESYKEFKGDSYVTYVFDGREDVAYSNDLYPLFAVLDAYNTLFYEFDVNENLGASMLHKFGPLSYKILDYVEAVKFNDTPNAIILAEELNWEIENIFSGGDGVDTNRFEEFKEIDLSNNIKDAFDDLDEIIAKYEAEEIDTVKFANNLVEFKETLDDLFEKVEILEKTEGITKLVKFVTRKVHELEHKFTKTIIDNEEDIVQDSLLDYSFKFFTAQTAIDDCLNAKLTTLESYSTNLATFNTLMDDFSELIQSYVTFMGKLNLEDQLLYSFGYAIEETYLYNENLGESKFQAFIDSKHNELATDNAVLYAKLDDLDAAYKLDDAHLKEYIDAVNGVLSDLNALTIKAGEYKEVFGEIPSIVEDAELINLTYAKGVAILNNIRGRQTQYAIETIVLEGSDLTDRVNNVVENKGPVSECDALIEELNSLITKINDNYEALGQDERLSQTRDKMNENIEEINNLKAQVKAENTRNIVLIVVGSVVGAVLFFVGGFFVAKLLSKKSKQEKENE